LREKENKSKNSVKTKLTITGGTGFENLFKDARKQQEHSPMEKPLRYLMRKGCWYAKWTHRS
jgi:hypothetical protein